MRAILEVVWLLASSKPVFAARRWVEADSPGSTLETEASTHALLASASQYLSQVVPEAELKETRLSPTVAALESNGISLEELFGWLVFSRQQQFLALEEQDLPHSLSQLHETPLEILGLQSTPINTNKAVSVDDELVEAQISPRTAEVDHHSIHTSLESYEEFHSWLDAKSQGAAATPMASLSIEQRQQWRRRQAMEAKHFFTSSDSVDDEKLSQAKELLEDSMDISMELDQFISFLDRESDVDWENSHRKLGFLGSSVRAVKNYVALVAHNSLELFRQTWRHFRRMMATSERRCVAMQSEAEGSEAQRVGLTSGNEMLDKSGGKLDEEELERQIERTESVLGALQEGQDETEAGLAQDVSSLRQAGDNLAASASSGVVEVSQISATEASLDQVSARVCKGSMHSVASKILGLFRSLRSAVGSALAIALPGYGMRGLAAMAGLQGGFEEVIDFRNREIGYFRWEVIDVGPSTASLGVSSYSAVGWKGYKINWTLQDAYQTAICKSGASMAPNIPALGPFSPSVGVTYCTDADNSGPIWVPELHGVNGVVFSAGVSASAAAWLPGLQNLQTELNKLGSDWMMAKYFMMTSECFDDLSSLLRGMYKPYCASCRGASEHAVVSGLRAATHSLAFPLVTEMLHTFIAYQYDRHVRPDDFRPPCSDLSTSNRDSSENILGSVARNLARSLKTIDRIEAKIGVIETELLEGLEANPMVTESTEWGTLLSDRHFCTTHPLLPKSLQEDDHQHDEQQLQDVSSQLRNRTFDELVTSCRQFRGIRGCSWRSKENLIEELSVRAATFASVQEPFGLCHRDSDCPLTNQECDRVNGIKQCKCREEFCHRLGSDNEDQCAMQLQGAPAVRQVIDDVRAYVKSQRMDVGQYVVDMQKVTSDI